MERWFAQLNIVRYLFFAVCGLVVGGVPLLALGHRLKRNHWLVALVYVGVLAVASRALLESVFTIPAGALTGPMVSAVVLGVLVTALTPQWNALAQASFAYVILASTGFLLYATQVTLYSHLGPVSLVFSVLLLVLEVLAFVLLVFHTFEVFDVVCRTRWKRVFEPRTDPDYHPMVSIHVPAYNEPPEMVKQTLDALAALDYPAYEVIVIDNNTPEEATWRPVEEHCARLGFKFFHLDRWPGYKAGALNFGLKQTDSRAEIIGVVDSDYVVDPAYPGDLVSFFRNPNVAFVQTPQDYRDLDPDDPYSLACYHAYQYFFKVSMATRNERNGIIFGGTMGLIRRSTLEELGGWDEWCITEDAEVSLRLLARRHESVFVDKTYGRGLMPLNFEALKKQRFRWAFGGMQVLRLHWRKLLPWSGLVHRSERLTAGQKYDYVSGGLQWLNDPLTFAFTMILILSGSALAFTHSIHIQPLAEAALFVPLVFIVFGVVKFLWAFRVRVRCSFVESYRAFVVLLGLTWAVTLACVLGLTRPAGVFLRTPKHREGGSLAGYLQVVEKELVLSVACLAVIGLVLSREPTGAAILFLSGLLLWQSFIYGSATLAAAWSWRSEQRVTDESRRRTSRTTGERIGAMITDLRAAFSVLGVVGLAVLLFFLSVHNAPETEKIFRTNPYQRPVVGQSLVRSTPAEYVKAAIYMEEQGTLHDDINRILDLWSKDAVIRDANYTPKDPSDDHVWVGLDGIRRRYQEELHARRYLTLHHENASVIIQGDSAVVVNDLDARLLNEGVPQSVYLSRGDRWVLEKKGDRWKIRSLTYNRARR